MKREGRDQTMTAKKYIMLLPVFAILLGLTCCGAENNKESGNFNIVLIVIDTLRSDHLPFYGYERNTAPFLWELSRQSAVFENAFSASSWTSPATASIFTSLYPWQHGVLMGLLAIRQAQAIDPDVTINRIPDEAVTIGEVLKENGYLTYGLADNLNIGKRQGFDQGFDKFRTYMYKEAPNVNTVVKSWRKQLMDGGKYFLYLHYMEPHAPYHAREPWFGQYYDEPDVEGEAGDRARDQRRRKRIAAYDSEINFVDQHIKELFELFQWDRDTLLIITSDHGEGLWDHGLMAHGKTLFREEIQVPLLIYLPGKKIARRVNTNVSTLDILPTVRDLAGTPPGEIDEGRSLTPLIEAGDQEYQGPLKSRNLFSYLWVKTNKTVEWKSSIYKNWHFIIKLPGARHLYSLLKDSLEQDNVISMARATAAELEKRFEGFMDTCKRFKQSSTRVKLDKKKTDQLKSLGYVQ
jgi:arylsulfatase A-like enzyme